MDPRTNPYAPGAGTLPPELAGRDDIVERVSIQLDRCKNGLSYRSFLMVGLIVALIAMVANIFFQIPALSLAISAAIIMIMSGLILYDTSRIIHGGETNYIRATVSLYLNVYNIFVHLLHLLGVMGGDD